MSNRLPGNLGEIFPLRFRLREELRFFRAGEVVITEKVKSGQRYSLKPWQHAMLMSFDGKATFESAAKRVYEKSPGAFTANGLLNFYNWLYSENLVLCECDSIFELVLGDPDSDRDGAEESREEPRLSDFASRLLENSTLRRVAGVAVALVFSLSVIRLVYVAAPVFEPPVNRLYAELGEWLGEKERVGTIAESHRVPAEPSVEAIEFASRAIEGAPVVAEEAAPQGGLEPVANPSGDLAPVASPQAAGLGSQIEKLRIQLEECRIRRDEFYLQNDEEGYRREVHRMTNLAREIGDIEKGR